MRSKVAHKKVGLIIEPRAARWSALCRTRPRRPPHGGSASPALMPSDLSSGQTSLLPGVSNRRRPRNAPAPPLSWNRVALLLFIIAAYSTFALAYDLPPWSTLEWWKHRNDLVVKHRPAFKKVERCVHVCCGDRTESGRSTGLSN